jgi:hypothetical protein
VWLVGNMAASSLSSTGAFEIYFNGDRLFSKLATGRLPTGKEFDEEILGPVRAAVARDPERFIQAAIGAAAARAPPAAVPTPGGAPRAEL